MATIAAAAAGNTVTSAVANSIPGAPGESAIASVFKGLMWMAAFSMAGFALYMMWTLVSPIAHLEGGILGFLS